MMFSFVSGNYFVENKAIAWIENKSLCDEAEKEGKKQNAENLIEINKRKRFVDVPDEYLSLP